MYHFAIGGTKKQRIRMTADIETVINLESKRDLFLFHIRIRSFSSDDISITHDLSNVKTFLPFFDKKYLKIRKSTGLRRIIGKNFLKNFKKTLDKLLTL